VFRVGRCDEPLGLRGITHLLEHLVTHAVYPADDEVDATVYDQRTSFSWEGEREQVLEWVRGLAAAFADPAPERLADEVRVLRIEGDDALFHGRVLRERFGARGFGAGGWREYGLGWIGEQQLRDWRDRFFTRGNAALWMTGEPPEELELALPPGPRCLPPAPEPISDMRLPAQRDFDDDGVAVSFVGEPSLALRCAYELASRRAHERLRYGLGLTYCVDDDYEQLDARTAHIWLQGDCLEKDAGSVRAELLAVLESLARDGPSAAELERTREWRLKRLADSRRAEYRLERYACDELLGAPRGGDEREQLMALTPEGVADALRPALDTLMVLAPESLDALEGFHAYDDEEIAPVGGKRHRARDARSYEELVVGPDGVSWLGDGDPLTVRFAHVCAARRVESGLKLIERDGTWIELLETDWVGGASLLEAIERALPEEVFVPAPVR
jgi:hypothetical protein